MVASHVRFCGSEEFAEDAQHWNADAKKVADAPTTVEPLLLFVLGVAQAA